MTQAIHDLVGALEADTLDTFVAYAKNAGASHLSSNLCEGLRAFPEPSLRANLDFSVAWSARLASFKKPAFSGTTSPASSKSARPSARTRPPSRKLSTVLSMN